MNAHDFKTLLDDQLTELQAADYQDFQAGYCYGLMEMGLRMEWLTEEQHAGYSFAVDAMYHSVKPAPQG